MEDIIYITPNGTEVDESTLRNEFGDLFFTLVSFARHLKINPENALRSSNRKFISRFKFMEDQLKAQNKSVEEVNLSELESLWEQAKESDQSEQ